MFPHNLYKRFYDEQNCDIYYFLNNVKNIKSDLYEYALFLGEQILGFGFLQSDLATYILQENFINQFFNIKNASLAEFRQKMDVYILDLRNEIFVESIIKTLENLDNTNELWMIVGRAHVERLVKLLSQNGFNNIDIINFEEEQRLHKLITNDQVSNEEGKEDEANVGEKNLDEPATALNLVSYSFLNELKPKAVMQLEEQSESKESLTDGTAEQDMKACLG